MRIYANIILVLFLLTAFGVQAETVSADSTFTLKSDSLKIPKAKALTFKKNTIQVADSQLVKPYKPNPQRAVWMGLILPGAGQMINKKYWKLPLVYGGFLGCAYAVSWNASHYQSYKIAYRDITDSDPATNSYLNFLQKGNTTVDVSRLTSQLKNGQDVFRRYRDLSVICTVAVYALSVVDAFVDAQLYDFDITPDLSLRLQPTLMPSGYGTGKTVGMQCSFSLK